MTEKRVTETTPVESAGFQAFCFLTVGGFVFGILTPVTFIASVTILIVAVLTAAVLIVLLLFRKKDGNTQENTFLWGLLGFSAGIILACAFRLALMSVGIQ
jgi:NADH:ubiquinone oxidoreductase subunit 6 (subunit J)